MTVPASAASVDWLPRATTGREAPYVLLTLLGDYWMASRQHIPAPALIDLLDAVDITEASARQAMRRLTERGLLERTREGRTTAYGRPPALLVASAVRMHRIARFGTDFVDWDGRWTIVSYSIPERDRDVRHALRGGLRELKFGQLHGAMWVSPHHREERALALLDSLGVTDASVARAEFSPRAGRDDLLAEAFALDAVRREYDTYLEQYRDLPSVLADGISGRDALALRTQARTDWLHIRDVDPVLPRRMLPADWPQAEARELARLAYDELAAPAAAHVASLVGRWQEDLAETVTTHRFDASDVPMPSEIR